MDQINVLDWEIPSSPCSEDKPEENYKNDSDVNKKGKQNFLSLFKTPVTNISTPKIQRKKTPKRKFPEDGTSDQQRPRTPSGQVITSSIFDIKEALFKKNSNVMASQHDQTLPKVNECVNAVTHESTDSANSSSVTNKHLAAKHDEDQDNTPFFKGVECTSKPSDESSDQINSPQDVTGQQFHAEMETDNNTMDIRTVIQMIADLKAEMKHDWKNELQKCMEKQHQCKATEELQSMKARLQVCEARERMMVDTMSYMTGTIKELTDKIELMEINNAKKSVILSGLETNEKKSDCRKDIEFFLLNKMNTDIRIEDCYHIGQNTPRDVVIVLNSVADKRLIFQNIDTIKNLKNDHGKKYYFRDLLTAKQNQFRRKGQHIADMIQKRDDVRKEDVTTGGKDIFVGDRQYVKMITEPEATEVLRMPLSKLNVIMSQQADRCQTFECKENKFTPYSLCTNDPQKIQEMYMKLRLNHAEARHIVCAWNIPGMREYESADWCDDGEAGAGEAILKIMLENNISSRAIFVVRNCKGKLYQDRIPQYVKAAIEAVAKHPFNQMTNSQQKIQPPGTTPAPMPTTYAAALKSPVDKTGHTSDRGGVRGRGQGRGRGRGRGRITSTNKGRRRVYGNKNHEQRQDVD